MAHDWDDAKRLVAKIGTATHRGAQELLEEFAEEAVNEMRRLLSQGGRGGLVVRYRPKRSHRRSAPGDPPATDLGRLVNSLGWRVVPRGSDAVEVEVGAGTNYAQALELGTSRMSARPFMRPAVATAAATLRQQRTNLIEKRQRQVPGVR
jgi:hypothetical protein